MIRTTAENVPADPFTALIVAGIALLPSLGPNSTDYKYFQEAAPGSIGAVTINALGMLGLAIARHSGSTAHDMNALSRWAIPLTGKTAGAVAAVSMRRAQSDLGPGTSTSITLHSMPAQSPDHVGVLVRVDTRADGVTALDAGIAVLGAPISALAGGPEGTMHTPENAIHIDSDAISAFQATGNEDLGTYTAALPLLRESSQIIANLARNASAVR